MKTEYREPLFDSTNSYLLQMNMEFYIHEHTRELHEHIRELGLYYEDLGI